MSGRRGRSHGQEPYQDVVLLFSFRYQGTYLFCPLSPLIVDLETLSGVGSLTVGTCEYGTSVTPKSPWSLPLLSQSIRKFRSRYRTGWGRGVRNHTPRQYWTESRNQCTPHMRMCRLCMLTQGRVESWEGGFGPEGTKEDSRRTTTGLSGSGLVEVLVFSSRKHGWKARSGSRYIVKRGPRC